MNRKIENGSAVNTSQLVKFNTLLLSELTNLHANLAFIKPLMLFGFEEFVLLLLFFLNALFNIVIIL